MSCASPPPCEGAAFLPNFIISHGVSMTATKNENSIAAEAFAGMPVRGIATEQFVEDGEDRGFVDVLAVQRVQPLAAVVGAEHQVVAAGRLADQRDLAEVRARAAIRTAADAQVDARIEHDTARSDAGYAAKLDRYAALWAEQRHAAGKRAGPLAAPLHAATHWLKNYVLRGGFLDGGTAARYHYLHARYVHRKYSLLRRL